MPNYVQPIYTTGTVTYKDLDFSFKMNPFNGDVRTVSDLTDIQQSLLNLLNTNFGERPFQPDIGTNIQHLLFAPFDSVTMNELKSSISNVVTLEPRIILLDLTITQNPDQESLSVTFTYQMVNISDPQQFTIILQRIR